MKRENSVFPSFSSLLSNFENGNEDNLQLQMPNRDLSSSSFVHLLPRPNCSERNVHWSKFCMGSQTYKDDQLGHFQPPSPITHSTPDCHLPGMLAAPATSPFMEDIFSQKKLSSVSVPQTQHGDVHQVATIEENTKKRELKIADTFHHNNRYKRKKVVCSEEQCHGRPQSEKPSKTLEEQTAPVGRSQKLGDKISALQKLVSPFGKTDTASVLQEAYVNIKLLQEQVQMLTGPYFRVSPYRPHGLGTQEVDLQSRGLCLVPISFTQNLSVEDKTERSISKINQKNF